MPWMRFAVYSFGECSWTAWGNLVHHNRRSEKFQQLSSCLLSNIIKQLMDKLKIQSSVTIVSYAHYSLEWGCVFFKCFKFNIVLLEVLKIEKTNITLYSEGESDREEGQQVQRGLVVRRDSWRSERERVGNEGMPIPLQYSKSQCFKINIRLSMPVKKNPVYFAVRAFSKQYVCSCCSVYEIKVMYRK